MELDKPEWLAQTEGILETLNEGVMIVDDCSNVIFANSSLAKMTDFSPEDIVGTELFKFYTKEEADFIVEQRERNYRNRHNRFEFVVPRRNGTRLPVIISAKIVEDPDGRNWRDHHLHRHFRTKARRSRNCATRTACSKNANAKSRKTCCSPRACSKALRPNRFHGAAFASRLTIIPSAPSAATLAW